MKVCHLTGLHSRLPQPQSCAQIQPISWSLGYATASIALLREGIAAVLARERDIVLVAEAANGFFSHDQSRPLWLLSPKVSFSAAGKLLQRTKCVQWSVRPAPPHLVRAVAREAACNELPAFLLFQLRSRFLQLPG